MIRFHNPASMPPPASRYQQVAEIAGDTRLVLLSGQVGMSPDGHVPEDFEGQAEQVWRNIMAGLAAVDMGPQNLVRINSFITRPGDVGALRAIRETFLGDHECTSTLLVVAGLAAPHWLVEIEVIAAST